MKHQRILYLLMWLVISLNVQAVQRSSNGLGEVLFYPYYSVNNDLNTLYSVVNTTDQTKALKISFHEGDAGLKVLDLHVYLSAYDVWTGALGATMSTIGTHAGEPSVLHATSDTSCAPFLNKHLQEFLPFLIDTDLDPDNRSMNRSREGYIQIIEMGVLTGEAVQYADHMSAGVPFSCGNLQNAWETNEWTLDAPDAPTGGLYGSASLINVHEGLSLAYDAVALNQFWGGAGSFTAPGEPLPDLDSAMAESRVLLEDGTAEVSTWNSGIEAVSAVLMMSELYNEYAYDAVINGLTEWVVSFPTKPLHVNSTATPQGPFSQLWDGQVSCDEYTAVLYDRSTAASYQTSCCVDPPPPPPPDPQLCYSSNVIELLPPFTEPSEVSGILGSDNLSAPATYFDSRQTENGWGVVRFSGAQNMTPISGPGFKGLPAIGFAVQQFSNASAADGLLAQYGNLFKHQGRVELLEVTE